VLPFRDLSIKRKLTISGVATSIVVLLLASIAFATYELLTYREATISSLKSTAFVMGTNCTVTLSFEDKEAAELLLGSLSSVPNISAAGVYDVQGKLFSQYLRDNDSALLPPAPQPDGHYFANSDLLIFQPIAYEEERLGTIFLRSDTEALNTRLRNGGLLALLVMVFSSLLAYALSSKLQALVSEPIAQLAHTARVISSQRDYTLRAKLINQDETGRLVEAFNQMLEDLQHEMAQRQQAQEQISILARFPDENPNPIMRITRNGLVLYANLSASPLLAHWQIEVGDQLPREWIQRVTSAFTAGNSGESELIIDEDQILSLILTPVSEYDYLNIYGRNITNQRQAENSLRQSNDELELAHRKMQEQQAQMLQSEKMASIGQLAAGVAHELNNPVAFIFSNFSTLEQYIQDLSLLLASYDSLEEHIEQNDDVNIKATRDKIRQQKEDYDLSFLLGDIDELIAESRVGIERVRNIVLDLKDFSHVDKDQQMSVNLNESLTSTLNIVRGELEQKAEILLEFGTVPVVLCYPRELNQALMSMILNAAQAIEERGEIKIRTYQDNGFACIDISDDGIGIAPEIQKRIFEPFFTTKDVGSGTGMGLTVAYNTIVKQHRGELLVNSKEGKGTTFTAKIPV